MCKIVMWLPRVSTLFVPFFCVFMYIYIIMRFLVAHVICHSPYSIFVKVLMPEYSSMNLNLLVPVPELQLPCAGYFRYNFPPLFFFVPVPKHLIFSVGDIRCNSCIFFLWLWRQNSRNHILPLVLTF